MADARFDLAVIGAEACGLAAAACAAAAGASVVLVRTGAEPPQAFAGPPVPNFVWRALELHRSGYEATPMRARVTLLADGVRVRTFEDAAPLNGAGDGSAAGAPDGAGLIWPEFVGAVNDLAVRLADHRSPLDAPDAPLSLDALGTANEALDDYFADENLKTHLAVAALVEQGLGGDEAGSAASLSVHGAGGWRGRHREDGESLVSALRAACDRFSVETVEATVDAVVNSAASEEGRSAAVALSNGAEVRAGFAMAPTAAMARAAGLTPHLRGALTGRAGGVNAFVRITLDGPATEDKDDAQSVFYIVDDRENILAARDAMLEARLADAPPLRFEFDGRRVLACAAYCPSHFLDEDGDEREWTQQDRQALGRLVFERINSRFKLAASVKAIDVRVDPVAPGLVGGKLEDGAIITPAAARDEIGAAVRLALEAVGRG